MPLKLTALTALTSPSYDDLMYIVDDPLGVLPVSKGVTIQNLFSGAVNVKQYGAVGDGIANDTAALNAAWVAVSDGGVLTIPSGTYLISDTINWENKDNITIYGNKANIITKAGSNFTGKAMVSLVGLNYGHVDGLAVTSNLAINLPAVGIALGRWDAGDGALNYYSNCNFSGAFTHSTFYDVGSECTTFVHCYFQSTTVKPVYYTSSIDDAALCVITPVSNSRKAFYSCYFANFSSLANQRIIVIDNITKGVSIHDSFMALSEQGYCVLLEGSPASMYGLTLENIDVEGTNKAGSRLLYIGQDNPSSGMIINQITWLEASDYVIEAGTIGFIYSWLNALPYGTHTKYLKVSADCYYNVIMGYGNAQIDVDGGKNFTANQVTWMSSGSPFCGAGAYGAWNRDDNVLDRLYDYDSEASGAKRRMYGGYIDGATPTVAGGSIYEIILGGATTITNFLNGIPGQEITLIATDANATIQHNANIKLAGSANFVMGTGDTLTLIYHSHLGVWHETSRKEA